MKKGNQRIGGGGSLNLPKLPKLSEGLPPFELDSYKSTDAMTASTSSCTTNQTDGTSIFSFETATSGSKTSQSSHRRCASWMSPSPQNKWNVQDSSLKRVPSYHPPMNYNTSTYVPETSPSTVAARISHCLVKRSILTDYDDEAACATAFTYEGGFGNQTGCSGMFAINLYKGGKGKAIELEEDAVNGGYMMKRSNHKTKKSNPNEGHLDSTVTTSSPEGIFASNSCSTATSQSKTISVRPDFSHGVIVECTRIRGNTITFHRDVKAIIASARGESDGLDDCRDPLLGTVAKSRFALTAGIKRSSVGESKEGKEDVAAKVEKLILPPLKLSRSSRSYHKTTPQNKRSDSVQCTCSALENALELIEKDRLCARLLGMQALVFLTDLKSSRLEKAYMSSLCILGCPMNFKSYATSSATSLSSSSFGESQELEEEDEEDSRSSISRIHERILWIIMRPGGDETYNSTDIKNSPSNFISSPCYTNCEQPQEKTPKFSIGSSFFDESSPNANSTAEELITMRRLAMQTLTNALTITTQYANRFPLLPTPQCEFLCNEDFVKRLAIDLIGATRPPISFLPCAHDATLAARLLGLIVTHFVEGRNNKITIGDMEVGTPPRKVFDTLERARLAGMSCHSALEMEAKKAMSALAGYEWEGMKK